MRALESHGKSRDERDSDRVAVIVSGKKPVTIINKSAGAENTYESGISILSSACDYWSTVGISDKKVRACQRFKYSTSCLSNENCSI